MVKGVEVGMLELIDSTVKTYKGEVGYKPMLGIIAENVSECGNNNMVRIF